MQPDKIQTFILANPHLSNREVAEAVGCALSTASWKRSKMGLKRMEMEYWTPVQMAWLRRFYTYIGDYEIALIFNEAYPKKKEWTLKHIEKKRNYLGLHRTKEQLRAIKKRNALFGCWMTNLKRLHDERRALIGTVRIWNGREYIKTEQSNESYNRYLWQQMVGAIPEGMNVVLKNKSLPVTIENLELLSDAELGQRNSMYRYPKELQEAIKSLNNFKRLIYEQH